MRLLKLLLILFVCAAAVLATVVVMLGPYEDAKAAYNKGDYAAVRRLLSSFILALAGNSDAQHNLGVMYDNGQGVTQDYAAAMSWYRKAAEQDDAYAQTNLGFMYANGRGVPQDYVQAVSWFRKAAEQGDAYAQTNLGVMYYSGRGVPQDYVQAHMWWSLAAAKGDADAINNLDQIAAKMTPAQIAEAQKLAREWKPK